MERGFLSSDACNKQVNKDRVVNTGSLFPDLAMKVKNIDGKMLGKDGKPLKALRKTKFADVGTTDTAVTDCSGETPQVDAVNDKGDKRYASSEHGGADGATSNAHGDVMNVEAESKVGETQTQGMSFANVLNSAYAPPRVNFRFLVNEERVEVELSADSELKSKVSMAVPNGDGGFTTEIIDVEYEWKPPHCDECISFGHSLSDCPNRVKETVRNKINVAAKLSVPVENHDEGFTEVRNRKNKGKNVASSSQSRPIGGIKLSKPKPNFWKPKAMTATNQSATIKDSDHKVQKEAFTSNVQTGTNSKSSNSFGVLESLVDEDVLGSQHNDKGSQDQPKCDMESKVQVEATKPSTYLSPSNSSTKRGNPFSKVGDVVVSDSSDDDEVLEDHIGTLYSGSGRNEQSTYEQWKADTGDCHNYEDDFFDDCGLSPAQLKAAAMHDFRLG